MDYWYVLEIASKISLYMKVVILHYIIMFTVNPCSDNLSKQHTWLIIYYTSENNEMSKRSYLCCHKTKCNWVLLKECNLFSGHISKGN
jgi:hypothetical protein